MIIQTPQNVYLMGVIVVEDTHGFVHNVNANVAATVQVQLHLMEVNVSVYPEKTTKQEYVVLLMVLVLV